MPRRPDHASAVPCPRCGYDVSGAIPTWNTQCPLEGTCSECGLGFSWSRLLDPNIAAPAWLFEHAARRRPLRFFTTAWRTRRPRRFWSAIKIELPVRPRRLWLFAAVWTALCGAAVGTLIGLMDWRWGGGALLTGLTSSLTHSSVHDSVIVGALWPLLALDPEYAWVVFGGHGKYLALMLIWCALTPAAFAPVSRTLRASRIRRAHLLRIWAHANTGLLALVLAGWFLPAGGLSLWLGLAERSQAQWPPGWLTGFAMPALAFGLPIVAAVWLFAFWSAAIGRYLSLPNPRATSFLLLLCSFLAAVAVIAYAPGSDLAEDLSALDYYFQTGRWIARWFW